MLNLSACQHLKGCPGLKWFLGVIPLFLLDQLSKWLVLENITWTKPITVMPGLQLIRAYNYGVAFSLLNQQIPWMQLGLLCFIVGICLFVAVWLVKTPLTDKWSGVALTMVLGGALGNLCDRLWHGYVVDFIDFYMGTWHWYTFNLADAFITLGAVMLIKTILFPHEPSKMAE